MSSHNTDHNSKYMFASQSHVRNACDACHKRKIRCIVSRNGGPCHNCRSRGLSCYFLPRYRSGRPRLREHSPPDMIEDHLIATPSSTVNNSPWPTSENPLASPPARKTPRASHQSSNDDLFDWVRPQDFALQTEQLSSSLQDSGQPLGFCGPVDGTLLGMQPTFSNFADPTRRSFTDVQPDVVSRCRLWSTTPKQPYDRSGSRGEESREGGFASLLDHCARLQRHLITTDEDTSTTSEEGALPTPKKLEVSDDRLQDILEDIDSSCKLLLEVCDEGSLSKPASSTWTNPPLDLASASLITAVVFKVFQLCEVLLSGQGLRVRSMKDVLLQKRLDFNITQARVVAARVEQWTQNRRLISQELSKKAMQIEERFTSQRGRGSMGMVAEPENMESPRI
ncbi:conserved hypothetical protein [Coccidioides posadasii str. Silveira]|uniref:Zn(2)-C6 fungal-type domain-containing protein n=2 Tax=Coccidioides posadasii (strain RMSCC 757 / Silveira) TaxID=443226 RepID=E9D339_COCPS|nr:conserved hypothetical protein [Coccidioides posadasii str. Silveira]